MVHSFSRGVGRDGRSASDMVVSVSLEARPSHTVGGIAADSGRHGPSCSCTPPAGRVPCTPSQRLSTLHVDTSLIHSSARTWPWKAFVEHLSLSALITLSFFFHRVTGGLSKGPSGDQIERGPQSEVLAVLRWHGDAPPVPLSWEGGSRHRASLLPSDMQDYALPPRSCFSW